MGKWTRRAFITTGVLAGGALAVGVAIRPGNRASKVASFVADEGETLLNIWLKIAKDNTVTAIIPHAEMGQGVHTALAMMVAEELNADWSKIRFEEAPAHKEYANHILAKGFVAGDTEFPAFMEETVNGALLTATKKMNLQITGGSASVRFTGMDAMCVAGATARIMLEKAAAETWEVPREELVVKNSYIEHPASNRKAPFAEFAEKAASFSAPDLPPLKSIDQYTIMGTSPARFDIPAKVDGTASFGIDVRPPNLKYASIKAAPVFGDKVTSVDESSIQDMPGVLKVVKMENAVAVVAEGYWQAKQALSKLAVEFGDSGNESVSQESIFSQYEKDLAEGKNKKDRKIGKTEPALKQASKVVEAEYRIPYLAHATMEPMNCTVWIHDNQCEVWTGTQNPLGVAGDVAKVLEMDHQNVSVHNQLLGGGFGRRAETDVAKQAALIAKEVDYPVQLIWSREEDMQHDVYREANISRFKAGLDENGLPVAWDNQFLFKHHPKEAPYIPYGIKNQLIHYVNSKTHVPWGNWRSVDHSMHGFFTESFIDELAHAAGKDPFEYRRDLLDESPKFKKVLEVVAEKADWGKTLPTNWGRGIAIHQSFGTIVAEVAEVEVRPDGQLKTHRVICVADPGFAVHPDGFKAQMESGVIYGLTAALYGEISIKDGAVAQSNFHDYNMVRMNDAPLIETHIINSGDRMGGAGEPSTPVIAPALANAIFDATGKRIRELPVSKHDLSEQALKG